MQGVAFIFWAILLSNIITAYKNIFSSHPEFFPPSCPPKGSVVMSDELANGKISGNFLGFFGNFWFFFFTFPSLCHWNEIWIIILQINPVWKHIYGVCPVQSLPFIKQRGTSQPWTAAAAAQIYKYIIFTVLLSVMLTETEFHTCLLWKSYRRTCKNVRLCGDCVKHWWTFSLHVTHFYKNICTVWIMFIFCLCATVFLNAFLSTVLLKSASKMLSDTQTKLL